MSHLLRIAIVLSLLGGIAAGTLAQYAPGQKPSLSIGSVAYDFALKDSAGKTWKLEDFKGRKVVLLDFGATHCIPCRSVARDLEKLNQKYKDKSLQIFTICLNGPARADLVPDFIREMKIHFPVLLDLDFKVARNYYVEVIPYLVLVDLKGRVAWKHTGYDPDMVRKLSREIDALLPKGRKAK